jgi:1-acyl-sn-glycerol-3-phosphate acyltransferase
VKRELGAGLVAGVFLRRLRVEFVERFDARASLDDMRRLSLRAGSGESFVVFPEGTFTRAPELLPFRLGAFELAAESGLPIVPVALSGTRSLLRDGSWFPRRARIAMTVMTPIASTETPDVFSSAVILRDTARKRILESLSASGGRELA